MKMHPYTRVVIIEKGREEIDDIKERERFLLLLIRYDSVGYQKNTHIFFLISFRGGYDFDIKLTILELSSNFKTICSIYID